MRYHLNLKPSNPRFQGTYCDDLDFVAKQYLLGPFWFDLVTSIPVSIVELWAVSHCSEDNGPGVETNKIRIIRIIKPLRSIVRLPQNLSDFPQRSIITVLEGAGLGR